MNKLNDNQINALRALYAQVNWFAGYFQRQERAILGVTANDEN